MSPLLSRVLWPMGGFTPFTSYLGTMVSRKMPLERRRSPAWGENRTEVGQFACMHPRSRPCQSPDIPQQGRGRVETSHPVIMLPTDQLPSCSVAATPQGLGEPREDLGGREHRPRRPWGPTRAPAPSGPPPTLGDLRPPCQPCLSPASEAPCAVSALPTPLPGLHRAGPSPFLMAPGTGPKGRLHCGQTRPRDSPSSSCPPVLPAGSRVFPAGTIGM